MKMKSRMTVASALAALAFTSGAARADDPPMQTTTHDGLVAQVLVNPHGDPDGVLLRDGGVVRFPPHALASGTELRAGTNVHAEGEAFGAGSTLTLFDGRVLVGGRVVVDSSLPPPAPPREGGPRRGPPERDADLQPMTVNGRVRVLLTNPDGITDGFVLEDGTVVHAGPRSRVARSGIALGTQVTVTGFGGAYPQGRSLRAETLKIGNGPVLDVDRRPRPPAPPAP